jgi:hypothetical protein
VGDGFVARQFNNAGHRTARRDRFLAHRAILARDFHASPRRANLPKMLGRQSDGGRES